MSNNTNKKIRTGSNYVNGKGSNSSSENYDNNSK